VHRYQNGLEAKEWSDSVIVEQLVSQRAIVESCLDRSLQFLRLVVSLLIVVGCAFGLRRDRDHE